MQNFALHSKHRSAGGLNTDADAQQIVEGRGTRIFIRPSLIYSFDNAQALDSVWNNYWCNEFAIVTDILN